MEAVQFGFSKVSTYDADTGASETAGIMGIGLDAAEEGPTQFNSTPYPNILSTMAAHGVIHTRAFSLYLNSLGRAPCYASLGCYHLSQLDIC